MRAVVVGGGLAGCAAALELRARGSEVVLVRTGPAATAMSWGTLDVAAASPLRRGGLPLRDPSTGRPIAPAGRLLAAANAGPGHPYATLLRGRSAAAEVKESAATLDGWLAPSGLRVLGGLDQTRWLADLRGAVRAADLAFTGAGEGDLVSADEIALVDVPGLAGFDARAALRVLAGELAALRLPRRPLRLLRLELPPALAELGGAPARLARALEAPGAREALRPSLESLGADGRMLLFPPVLGLEGVAPLLTWISDTVRCRCAELLGAPPLPLAGYRLDRALGAALSRAGVDVRAGRALAVEGEAGRATRLRVADLAAPDGVDATLALDALVLATGRFVGGGVAERDGRLAETLLDLPLYDLAGRRVDGMTPRRLARRDYEGEQPLFSAGVRTDTRLRPLGPEGDVRLANVFAAGDLLGSFDPARERTGLGVALLSGRRAGIEAAKC